MSKVTLEGIVLKSKNSRESDKIYTVYTQTRGKIKATARGVRKITSKRGGNLDVMNQVEFTISEGLSVTPLITEAQVLNSFPKIKENLNSLTYGYSFLELVDKFLPEGEAHVEIYSLIANFLKYLGSLDESKKRLALIYFEFKLLSYLGYDPVLGFCANCLRDLDTSWRKIKFNAALGGLVCDRCDVGGLLIYFDSVESLKSISNSTFNSFSKSESNEKNTFELEQIVNHFVEYILEAPLKSFKAFTS